MRSIGIENFQKEILFEAESAEEMFDKERELVTLGSHSYNLKEGGSGGFDYINRLELNNHKTLHSMQESGKRAWRSRSNESKEHHKQIFTEKIRARHQNGLVAHLYWTSANNPSNLAWTESAREKRQQTRKQNRFQQGNNNSQYGTMWITDGVTSRKIKRDEAIPEGWRKGRHHCPSNSEVRVRLS